MQKHLSLLITTILLLAFMVQGCSQPKPEHLTFMDISMGEPIDKFANALKEKGFKHIAKENGMTIMEGEFTGSPVQVAIREITETKDVAMIMVEFPTQTDKSQARNLFDKYGELLDGKYLGCFVNKDSRYFQHLIENPNIEQIQRNPNATLGDYKTYFAAWKVSKGEIAIHVYNSTQFQIIYADSINYEKSINEINRKMGKDL